MVFPDELGYGLQKACRCGTQFKLSRVRIGFEQHLTGVAVTQLELVTTLL